MANRRRYVRKGCSCHTLRLPHKRCFHAVCVEFIYSSGDKKDRKRQYNLTPYVWLVLEDIGVTPGSRSDPGDRENSVGLIGSEIEVLHDLTLFLSFILTVCDQIQQHAFRHLLSWWIVRDLGDSRDSDAVVLLLGLVGLLRIWLVPPVKILGVMPYNPTFMKWCQLYLQNTSEI